MVVLDLVCNPREGLSICNTFHLTTLIAPVVRRTASASRVAVVGELLERCDARARRTFAFGCTLIIAPTRNFRRHLARDRDRIRGRGSPGLCLVMLSQSWLARRAG